MGVRVRTYATAAIVVLLAGCSANPVACPDTVSKGQVWIATRVNVEGIQQINSRVASRFFASPESYVIEGWETFPWLSNAARAGYWPSAQGFAEALRRYPDQVASLDAAVYDPEPWPSTPTGEQKDPVAAMRSFAEEARGAGLEVVLTPETTLVGVDGASCTREEEETVEAAFLRCDLAGSAAEVADVLEIQAQSLQSDPETYRAFLVEAVAQARQADPDVKVISGLAIRSEEEVEQAERAWASVTDVVDGHYVSMDAALGERFLSWVDSCTALTAPS